jgi:hypothetical protein
MGRLLRGYPEHPLTQIPVHACEFPLGPFVSRVVGVGTTNVSAPSLGELFSKATELSLAILLSYGTAHVPLAGDTKAREEEYMVNGPYAGPLTVVRVHKYKNS